MRHINVALFVPHEGCMHQCSFCNQKSISGKMNRLIPEDIEEAVKTAKMSEGLHREICFFGGSFTAIDRDYMISLLETAAKHIDGKEFSEIRISTRPDAVDEEICSLLKEFKVKTIELGAQSMDDSVLRLNRRGHTAEDVIKASETVKREGLTLGLQMMTGLPGSSETESIETAEKIISLKPECVRIYPAIVLKNTELSDLYEKGEYTPQSVDEAVSICAELLKMFFKAGIDVIRLGLHSGGNVGEDYVAGPYHPSFGELCENEIYKEIAYEKMREKAEYKSFILKVNPKYISQLTGQKRKNIEDFKENGYTVKVQADGSLGKYEVNAVGIKHS